MMRFPCMINLCLHNENAKYYHRDENDNNENNDDGVCEMHSSGHGGWSCDRGLTDDPLASHMLRLLSFH